MNIFEQVKGYVTAVLVADGVICQEEPDDDAKAACQELGKSLA